MRKYNQQYEQENHLLIEFLKRYPKEEYSQIYPELYSEAFERYCIEEIFPLIRKTKGTDRIQKEAKKTINYILIGMFVFFILFFLFVVIQAIRVEFFVIPFSIMPISAFIFFSILIIYCIYYAYKEHEVKQQIKNRIFPKLFSLFANCEYVISKEETQNFKAYLSNLSLFKKRGGFYPSTCEDFFKLKYKGIDIDLCETTLTGVIIHLGDDTKIMHKGGASIFYRVKINKSFSSKTFIFKKMYYKEDKNKTENRITLESKEFNDLFVVKTTNQIEARTFITPAFMQRLVDFANKNHYNELSISFENGYMNLCFAAYMFSSFEIDDIKEANVNERIEKLRYAMIDLQEHLCIADDLSFKNIV